MKKKIAQISRIENNRLVKLEKKSTNWEKKSQKSVKNKKNRQDFKNL